MSDRFPTLRERLKQADPELASDLEFQWQIATHEWLPSVPPSKDSSNSLPHLRNIEAHLNDVFGTLQRQNPAASMLDMRPVELYVLLASVLFHDLGRVLPETHGVDHGATTRTYLTERYNDFGVRNRELAHSIGSICGSHNVKPRDRWRAEQKLNLGDVVIDPYGLVREPMIAALLTLGDHMDGSHTRVVPDYLKKNKEVLGSFRNIVRGVAVDPASRCVRTTVVPARDAVTVRSSSGWKAQPRPIRYERDPEDKSGWWTARLAEATGVDRIALRRWSNLDGINMARVTRLCGRLRGEAQFDLRQQLMTWKVIRVAAEPIGWDRATLLAIVMGDVRSNAEALYSIRDHLAAVGLPLATWLVDHGGHLYTPDCRESYEPRLDKRYLGEIANTMWELSSRVFGVSQFTYPELASQLGDRDVARARLAAKRLAMVTSKGEDGYSPIWAGDETWMWRVANNRDGVGCVFRSISEVTREVTSLAEPADPTLRDAR